MTQATMTQPVKAGAPRRISYEEFLALPGNPHVEWVDGEVVRMPPVTRLHSELGSWLIRCFKAFLEDRPTGELFYDPFQQRLVSRPSGRAPDLMVVLNEHLDRLRDNYLDGPADLVIEILSPGNASTDYVDKYHEYQADGVPEYWIVDPFHEEASFFLLADGRYERGHPDAEGVYRSTVIPGLALRVEWLWKRPPLREVAAEFAPAPANTPQTA
jgi:Uma2 family endonuclease